jgi:hypothetical protein
MTGQRQRGSAAVEAERWLRWTGAAFAVGFAIHGADHLRRGMSASPLSIMIGGNIQAVLVAAAVIMAWTHRRRAPEAAMWVGFASAIVFTYAHLLPGWFPHYSDSFVSLPHTNVTWFSWMSAVTEIGTGLVFGLAGIHAKRTTLSTEDAGSRGTTPHATSSGPPQ